MIIKNIFCYFSRSLKMTLLTFSIVFLLSTFFIVFIGYQNIYNRFEKIEYGQYVIETEEKLEFKNKAISETVRFGEMEWDYWFYIEDSLVYALYQCVDGYAIDFLQKPSFFSDLESDIICGHLPGENEILINERLAFLYSFILNVNKEELIGKRVSFSHNYGEAYCLDNIYISGIVSNDVCKIDDNFSLPYQIITDIDFGQEDAYLYHGRTYKTYIDKYYSIKDCIDYLEDNNIKYWFDSAYEFNYNFLLLSQFELIISILGVLSSLVVCICFINLVTTIDFKAIDQERYFRMLRKIGYSTKKCKRMFIFENMIIYIFCFIIAYLASVGFIWIINKYLLVDRNIFLELDALQHFILAVLCFGIGFGILSLISYFKVRNRFTKANS